MYLRFYDSSEPAHVPSGVAAAYYVGGFAWDKADIERMSRVFAITEVAGFPGFPVEEAAKLARCIAVEPRACSLATAVEFGRARFALGYKDFTIYSSDERGDDPDYQPGMQQIVTTMKQERIYFRLHVAQWDNNPDNRPQYGNVAAWSKQFAGNLPQGYDLNVLYGKDDLVRP